jgi:hypothetical protein
MTVVTVILGRSKHSQTTVKMKMIVVLVKVEPRQIRRLQRAGDLGESEEVQAPLGLVFDDLRRLDRLHAVRRVQAFA